MNPQRWIALGMLAIAGICIATSNIWLTTLQGADSRPTPTPTLALGSAALQSAPGDAIGPPVDAIDLTPTLDPVIADLMRSMGEDSAAISNQPFVILAGDFTTIDSIHQATGTASIFQVGETRRVLRLDPFRVTNGPDLHVLLSRVERPRTSAEAFGGSEDLGPLAGTDIAQNFEILPGTSLDTYKSVVIYSLSLQIVYSTATLETVRGQ